MRASTMTKDQRDAEIARLEAKRDYLLERAPKHFGFRRYLILPMMGVLVFMLVRMPWGQFAQHPAMQHLGGLVAIGLFTAFVLRIFWVSWIRPPAAGDSWAQSDTLGYEGDSPRDVQRKIDALKTMPIGED